MNQSRVILCQEAFYTRLYDLKYTKYPYKMEIINKQIYLTYRWDPNRDPIRDLIRIRVNLEVIAMKYPELEPPDAV